MSSLEVYKNHEVMNFASEMMKRSFEKHEIEGGEYDDDITKKMATSIIASCMPHILDFLHTHVVVEATRAHVHDNKDAREAEPVNIVEGLHVEAKFKHIEFQPVKEVLYVDRIGGLLLEDYDLFAVMRPQYFDPDPGAIVVKDEVMVPFGDITHFEPSERTIAS